MPDIDIDTQSSFNAQTVFKYSVAASMVKNGKLSRHPVGTYFQTIPIDNETSLAAIPYEEAEDLGYFKVDFLHLTFLDNFTSKQEIRRMLKREPKWMMLQVPSIVAQLSHISNHFDMVYQVKPQSIQELADILALIRPGKRYLLKAYIKDRDLVREELYKRPDDTSAAWFKRSHSIAYAHNILLQMLLIEDGKLG